MIVGHEKNLGIIRELFNRETISLCFSGKEGIGKKKIALELISHEIGKVDGEAVHPDLFFIKPSSNMIKLDSIRALIEFASLKSYSGGRKFALIDGAHLMNRESQNALLKLLEEPPIGMVIILITDKYESLLPTIRSRLLNIRFNPLSDDEVEKILHQKPAKEILELAGGSAGLAQKYLNTSLSDLKDFMMAFILRDPIKYTKEELEVDQFMTFTSYTICVLKDALKVKGGDDARLDDTMIAIKKGELTRDKIISLLKTLDSARRAYLGNANKRLLLADLFIS